MHIGGRYLRNDIEFHGSSSDMVNNFVDCNTLNLIHTRITLEMLESCQVTYLPLT